MFKLKQLQSWAGFTEGAVTADVAEQILRDVTDNEGRNLPIEWHSHRQGDRGVIVLDHTRRLYQRAPTLYPDLIHDVIWWNRDQGKWETAWVQWFRLWHGPGAHASKSALSVCYA